MTTQPLQSSSSASIMQVDTQALTADGAENCEILIPPSKLEVIKTNKEFIVGLFNVRIDNAGAEGALANKSKKRIRIVGESSNCLKAKKYVQALHNPDFTHQMIISQQVANKLNDDSDECRNTLVRSHQVNLIVWRDKDARPQLIIAGEFGDVTAVKTLIESQMNSAAPLVAATTTNTNNSTNKQIQDEEPVSSDDDDDNDEMNVDVDGGKKDKGKDEDGEIIWIDPPSSSMATRSRLLATKKLNMKHLDTSVEEIGAYELSTSTKTRRPAVAAGEQPLTTTNNKHVNDINATKTSTTTTTPTNNNNNNNNSGKSNKAKKGKTSRQEHPQEHQQSQQQQQQQQQQPEQRTKTATTTTTTPSKFNEYAEMFSTQKFDAECEKQNKVIRMSKLIEAMHDSQKATAEDQVKRILGRGERTPAASTQLVSDDTNVVMQESSNANISKQQQQQQQTTSSGGKAASPPSVSSSDNECIVIDESPSSNVDESYKLERSKATTSASSSSNKHTFLVPLLPLMDASALVAPPPQQAIVLGHMPRINFLRSGETIETSGGNSKSAKKTNNAAPSAQTATQSNRAASRTKSKDRNNNLKQQQQQQQQLQQQQQQQQNHNKRSKSSNNHHQHHPHHHQQRHFAKSSFTPRGQHAQPQQQQASAVGNNSSTNNAPSLSLMQMQLTVPVPSLMTIPTTSASSGSSLRFIVIDASNVAREHGNQIGRVFSCRGIQLVVEHFLRRGHREIRALVPRFRRGTSDTDCPTMNPEILDELEKQGFLAYTPSRYVNNKLILPYDDRFILKAAHYYNAVIVSNDNYRDLMKESVEWKRLVENNLLQYTFIGDLFMVADDPMGRRGPNLDQFLSNPR